MSDKTYHLKHVRTVQTSQNGETFKVVCESVSDGFHTMAELYDHRRALTIALFNLLKLATDVQVLKVRAHFDGSMIPGYFQVIAIHPEVGQVSYHYANEYWDLFKIPEADRSPVAWDGHEGTDVVDRLTRMWGNG